MNRFAYRLIITSGEPAGIGPDICLSLVSKGHIKRFEALGVQIVFMADSELLAQRAIELGISVRIVMFEAHHPRSFNEDVLLLMPFDLMVPCTTGIVNPDNSPVVLKMLDCAVEGCLNGTFDGIVTAPVHKQVINQVLPGFIGHTEYFEKLLSVEKTVMMMVSQFLRVALVTTHIPLSQVCKVLSYEMLCQVMRVLYHDLISLFGCVNPLIKICGLNPHAGEGGVLGCEELEIITPVLQQLRAEGMNLIGPVSADTAFLQHGNQQVPDAILAMYHDQGLPAFKVLSFGQSANVTLGLPIIRTSVDHGTALGLAGTGKASEDSLVSAVQIALAMCIQKRKQE